MPLSPWTRVVLAITALAVIGPTAHASAKGESDNAGTKEVTLSGTVRSIVHLDSEPAKSTTARSTDRQWSNGLVIDLDRGGRVLVRTEHPMLLDPEDHLTIGATPTASRMFDLTTLIEVKAYPKRGIIGPPPPTTTPPAPTGRALKLLVVLHHCSNPIDGEVPSGPGVLPYFYDQFVTTQLNPWSLSVSGGRRSYAQTVTHWLDLCPNDATQYTPEQAANLAGYAYSDFAKVVHIQSDPNPTQGIGGYAANIPGKEVFLWSGTLRLKLWTHEIGHTDNLVHGNSLACTSAGGQPVAYEVNAQCFSDEYGDNADAMGDPPTAVGLSAPQLDSLGWVAPVDVTTTSAHAVTAMGYPSATGPKALRIALPSGTYYVENRKAVGVDSGLSGTGLNGILVHVVGAQVDAGGIAFSTSMNPHLLDATPLTPGSPDWAIPGGASFTTPEGVTITNALLSTQTATAVMVSFPPGARPPAQPRQVSLNSWDPTTRMATVSWSAPLNDGGSPVLEYQVIDDLGMSTAFVSAAAPLTATIGPVNDQYWAVKIRARNAMGWSEWGQGNRVFFDAPPATVGPPTVSVVEGASLFVDIELPFPSVGVTTRPVRTHRTLTDTAMLGYAPGNGADAAASSPFAYPYAAFAPGQQIAQAQIVTFQDAIPEPDETFTVQSPEMLCMGGTIGSPNCTIWTDAVAVTIVDND